MECMAQEPVLFEDILCQIIDMIKPEVCHFIVAFIFISCLFSMVPIWSVFKEMNQNTRFYSL